jgi:hypothetical protein
VPSGKAIALAAMPTAVLMGMGFTPTLAQADDQPPSKSLTADEFKDCLAAIEDAEKDGKGEEKDGKDEEKDGASASPTPSPSASDSASPDGDSAAEPAPSASAGTDKAANAGTDKDTSSSSDSGSDDEERSAPAPSATAGAAGSAEPAEPAPGPSKTDRDLLEGIGDAIKDVLTPGGAATSPSPTPSASAPATGGADEDAPGTAEETAEKVPEAADTAKDTTDRATRAAEDGGEAAGEATPPAGPTPTAEATASPSPSGTAETDLEDCPVATDAEGGVDNRILLPDDPWYLNASSLLLKGADYQGIVKVRTAGGTVKKVLKYVISDGTDIGDLHQTVKDERSGKTYHVQARKGSTSTIRDGDTVMYTERISGKLLGLIDITFDPEHPPPLNIPLIHFTDVTVQQAGQFGGTLHIPGLRQYVTD